MGLMPKEAFRMEDIPTKLLKHRREYLLSSTRRSHKLRRWKELLHATPKIGLIQIDVVCSLEDIEGELVLRMFTGEVKQIGSSGGRGSS